jgi:dihydrofolate reductase
MSNVVYFVASSLDGYIADSTGSLEWLTSIENAPSELSERFMESVGVQVMGSTTFEWLCTHENLIAEPEKWNTFFGDLKTIVFSSGTLELPENAEIMVVSGSVAEHLKLMQEMAGDKDIWLVGGGKLASQFLDAGLLNRVEITYAPVVLGSGTELFGSPQYATSLNLITAETFGSFTHLCFEVAAN